MGWCSVGACGGAAWHCFRTVLFHSQHSLLGGWGGDAAAASALQNRLPTLCCHGRGRGGAQGSPKPTTREQRVSQVVRALMRQAPQHSHHASSSAQGSSSSSSSVSSSSSGGGWQHGGGRQGGGGGGSQGDHDAVRAALHWGGVDMLGHIKATGLQPGHQATPMRIGRDAHPLMSSLFPAPAGAPRSHGVKGNAFEGLCQGWGTAASAAGLHAQTASAYVLVVLRLGRESSCCRCTCDFAAPALCWACPH